jgi:hypothetical protein
MGEVIQLFYDHMRNIIISVGSDGQIRVWKLTHNSVDDSPEISCLYSQPIKYDHLCPPRYALSTKAGKLAISYYGSFIILDYVNEKSKISF